MDSDFQVDVGKLREFRDALRANIIGNAPDVTGGLINDTQLTGLFNVIGPPQPSTIGFGENFLDFDQAQQAAKLYGDHYQAWRRNYQSLLNALESLAAAIDTIANNYDAGSASDTVGAQGVDAAFNTAPPTQVPINGASPGK
jgi:hypothetical protein